MELQAQKSYIQVAFYNFLIHGRIDNYKQQIPQIEQLLKASRKPPGKVAVGKEPEEALIAVKKKREKVVESCSGT